MAKVLFINPVIREEDAPRHVPYGMALLASLAMKEGNLVQVDVGQLEPEKIAGIIYRAADGGLQMTAERKLMEDLDALPCPAYELFPLEEVYFKNSQVLFSEEGMVAKRRLDINASYGCSLICK